MNIAVTFKSDKESILALIEALFNAPELYNYAVAAARDYRKGILFSMQIGERELGETR